MTTEEVERLPEVLASAGRGAVKNASEAGFGGVELHSAHGYLLEELLRSSSNQCTDKYGGSLENRYRVALEAVDAVVVAIGADRTGIRLSPFATFSDAREENPVPAYVPLLYKLNERKLSYAHIIESRVNGDLDNADVRGRSTKPLRETHNGTLVVAGGFLPVSAAAAVENGAADLVAIGWSFVSHPDLVERFRIGAELRPYDHATFYHPLPGYGPEQRYTDSPFLNVQVRAKLKNGLFVQISGDVKKSLRLFVRARVLV